jgi:nitrogen fixation protein NifQ
MQPALYLKLMDLGHLARIPQCRDDEYGELLALLLAHAASPDAAPLAAAVAKGCLGHNHLWQDLGLPHRQALSDLLQEHFPHLFARNAANMRWKKFFYLQLCEQAEIRACRAPSCGVCAHQAECFGDEAGQPLRHLGVTAQPASL